MRPILRLRRTTPACADPARVVVDFFDDRIAVRGMHTTPCVMIPPMRGKYPAHRPARLVSRVGST
jgi:hypothetical protein